MYVGDIERDRKEGAGKLESDSGSGRAGSLARGERGAQLAVDAGLCGAGKAFKGGASYCWRGGEPCEGGAGNGAHGTRRCDQSRDAGEISGGRTARRDTARARCPYGAAAPIHAAAAPGPGYFGRYGFSGIHLTRGGNGRGQLPAAELPAQPSCARYAGYVLCPV